jgi:hypothetical protein
MASCFPHQPITVYFSTNSPFSFHLLTSSSHIVFSYSWVAITLLNVATTPTAKRTFDYFVKMSSILCKKHNFLGSFAVAGGLTHHTGIEKRMTEGG